MHRSAVAGVAAAAGAILLQTAVAGAQLTPPPAATAPATPATQPASAPSTAPVDATTPKGALKMLTRALESGDRAALLDLLSADSPAEQRIAEATAVLAEATADLRRASVKAFGAPASLPLGVNESAVPEALARIDASTVTIDGEKATVTSPQDAGDTLSLVRREGKWRVPMSQISGQAEPPDLDRNLRDSARQASVLKELANEVAAGKFKSAMDARQELNKRIMQLAMPDMEGAATKPTTTTAPVK